MDKVEIDKLNKVRFYTERSISDCAEALKKSQGDVFAAIKALLTPMQITALRSYTRTTELCPANLTGPPTRELLDLLDYLQAKDPDVLANENNARILRQQQEAMRKATLGQRLESFSLLQERTWLENEAEIGLVIFKTCNMVPARDDSYTSFELAEIASNYFGLTNSPSKIIDLPYGRKLTREILHREMVFHDVRLSIELVDSLTNEFFQQFGETATYFTNSTFSEEPFHLKSWSPCTVSTFDTGVLAIAGSAAGIIWAADDD